MADETLTKDQQRLAKLWDAYEEQEREFNLAVKKISGLENKMKETSKINDTLKKVTEGRDREIRELEIKLTALEEENEQYRPELERLEKLFQDEKERYAKLFAITEELEEELETARTELELRDRWFQQYFGQLENFTRALKERSIMIRESKITSPEKVKPVKFEKVEDILDRPDTDVAGKDEEEKKTVKFEKVEDDEEEDKKSPSEDAPADEPLADDDTATAAEPDTGALEELMKLDLIDEDIGKALINADIKSIAQLTEMTTIELAKVDGVSPTLARKIIESAKEHH